MSLQQSHLAPGSYHIPSLRRVQWRKRTQSELKEKTAWLQIGCESDFLISTLKRAALFISKK